MDKPVLDPLRPWEVVVADAVELLGALPDESFDTLWLDWPYSQASPVRGKDDGAASRIFGPGSFLATLLRQVYRVARPGGHVYLFGDWKGIPDAGYTLSTCGLYPTTIIAWDKCYVGTGSFWRSSWDPIFFASKGPAEQRTDHAFANVVRVPAVRRDKRHPYEKPPELFAALGRPSVREGTRVLDPFAGSAASREPCRQAGGIWYGADVDPTYAG